MIPRNNIAHPVPEIGDVPPIADHLRDAALRVLTDRNALDLTDALGLSQGEAQ